MRLSSIIAKQIRMKHLNEGIKHAQIRNKYRNYKLKQNYQLPTSHPDRFYLYSNIHGNEFQFKKQHFDNANFDNPLRVYPLVLEFQEQLNREIYKLWEENHSLTKREYFSANKKLVLLSIVAVWVVSILLCIAGQLLSELVSEQTVEWAIISVIGVAMLANVVVFVKTNCTSYLFSDYDNEIVILITSFIIEREAAFEREGIKIECDREVTWICFRNAGKDPQEKPRQQSLPRLSQELAQEMGSDQ